MKTVTVNSDQQEQFLVVTMKKLPQLGAFFSIVFSFFSNIMETSNVFIQRTQGYEDIQELKKVFGFDVPLDGLSMIASQRVVIDIIKLDKLFSYHDDQYNCIESLYKGKPCSIGEYIEDKFGEKYCDMVEKLL